MKTTDTSIPRRSRRLTLSLRFTILIAVLWGISAAPTPTVKAQSIGEIGFLRPWVEGASTCPVGVDAKALDAFYDAMVSHDSEGMTELVNAERVMVPDVGTKVRVIVGGSWTTMKVRILEGPYKGRSGFVSSRWVGEK